MDQVLTVTADLAVGPIIDVRDDPDLLVDHPLTLIQEAVWALGCLSERIDNRSAVVAIVGLGYVGLPLLVQARDAGYRVFGVDADPDKVDGLRAGRSHVVDVSADRIADLEPGQFTTDTDLLRAADVIVVAVPTPLRDGSPDLSLVEIAGRGIAASLRPGQLVVLESTTSPGTTEDLLVPILEHSGLRIGTDFAVGYSPERIDPGSGRDSRSVPKIISGVDTASAGLVNAFYSRLGFETHCTSSPREAEMAKLIENTFRQVNIGLVNELSVLANDLGIDIWASLEAAASKSFGYLPFWPGPGVGGHCIAVDPSFLSWSAVQRRGYGVGFIEHALSVNNAMPRYVSRRVADALNGYGKAVSGSRILVLGVTYKVKVNDLRESPAITVLNELMKQGALLSYSDPYVPELVVDGVHLISQPITRDALESADCVVVLTAHPEFDLGMVVQCAPLVFDAQGATRSKRADHVVLL